MPFFTQIAQGPSCSLLVLLQNCAIEETQSLIAQGPSCSLLVLFQHCAIEETQSYHIKL